VDEVVSSWDVQEYRCEDRCFDGGVGEWGIWVGWGTYVGLMIRDHFIAIKQRSTIIQVFEDYRFAGLCGS
jgi:hypothetical protein